VLVDHGVKIGVEVDVILARLGAVERSVLVVGLTRNVNAEVKAGQRGGAKPGQFAARRRVRSAASASAEMAGVS
jgi:hypothetical protein